MLPLFPFKICVPFLFCSAAKSSSFCFLACINKPHASFQARERREYDGETINIEFFLLLPLRDYFNFKKELCDQLVMSAERKRMENGSD
jgi:hypothetical protein